MRLVNTTSLEIVQFREYVSRPPPYAILSHTWDKDEVIFQEMNKDLTKVMPKVGYDKIYQSCQLAKCNGYDWIWVDTCCIDKTSSAELSEAINSMFRWYRDSAICYAYLSDAHGTQPLFKYDMDVEPQEWSSDAVPRWWSRGWTLQELIAASNVQFYSADWKPLGSKQDHLRGISKISGIDTYALEGGDLTHISIARRFAWLAKRETTRVEDMAYCLLGIFNINMPLLYGEGLKAFVRLQEELIRVAEADQSIFAWAIDGGFEFWQEFYASTTSSAAEGAALAFKKRFERQGLLADSPRMFRASTAIARFPWHRPTRPLPVCTGHGVRVYLLVCKDWIYRSDEVYLAVLDCQVGSVPGVFAGIRLRKEPGDRYSRIVSQNLLQFACCDWEGHVLAEGFNPMEKQDRLCEIKTGLIYKDWEPQWIYVAQQPMQKLPNGFWVSVSQPSISIREVQPLSSWDETTHIFQPLEASNASEKLGAIRLDIWQGIEVLLIFGISHSFGTIMPWCKLLPKTVEGQRLTEVSGKEAYTLLFPQEQTSQGELPDQSGSLRVAGVEVRVQVNTKSMSAMQMYHIELSM